MTIRRRNHGRGHSYTDTETGERLPGVTTITGALPKDSLIAWAANATADYVIDHWAELDGMSVAKRLKAIQGGRYEDRDTAANRGTQVHRIAERLVEGQQVPVPPEIAGHVASYVAFLDEWAVEAEQVECTVWHPEHKYCGTLDLKASILSPWEPGERVRALVDIKTTRSGVFGESALQLAGYRYAPMLVLQTDEGLVELPNDPVDLTAVVHVRADGYSLVPVTAEEAEFRQFLYTQQTYRWNEGSRDLVGEPLVPPSTTRYRLTEA